MRFCRDLAFSVVSATTRTVSLPATEPRACARPASSTAAATPEGRARLALDHHEVLGAQNADHELGEHTLEVQVLRQDVDALGQLAQAHVGNVSGDPPQIAGVAIACSSSTRPRCVRMVLLPDDLPDGVLSAVPALHGSMLPTMATPGTTTAPLHIRGRLYSPAKGGHARGEVSSSQTSQHPRCRMMPSERITIAGSHGGHPHRISSRAREATVAAHVLLLPGRPGPRRVWLRPQRKRALRRRSARRRINLSSGSYHGPTGVSRRNNPPAG